MIRLPPDREIELVDQEMNKQLHEEEESWNKFIDASQSGSVASSGRP